MTTLLFHICAGLRLNRYNRPYIAAMLFTTPCCAPVRCTLVSTEPLWFFNIRENTANDLQPRPPAGPGSPVA